MAWQYRILTDDDHAAIYEVYYDHEGRLDKRATNPSPVLGNDLEDMKGSLRLMTSALDLPPLAIADVDAAIQGTGPAIQAPPRSRSPP